MLVGAFSLTASKPKTFCGAWRL